MLQLRMMTHMHHIQNIKHLMYPKYPNEKYFNKVQVQYLSKCTEPPSVCGPAHVLVTGQCNSYCRTGEDQRGQHLPSFPLHPHASCSWKTLERNFLDLLLLVLLHFLVQMFLFMEIKTQSQLVTLVCDKSCFCFLCLGA